MTKSIRQEWLQLRTSSPEDAVLSDARQHFERSLALAGVLTVRRAAAKEHPHHCGSAN
jgi:hypothetical protein